LNICLRSEPDSLFLYADASLSARSLRQAIYDGPLDVRDYEFAPVILEQLPSLANGGASLLPRQVLPNEIIVDAQGRLTNLAPGVVYYPAGCSQAECAKTYEGSDPVSMDQLVARFTLKPGLTWSDGAALSADDSVYSYEVARGLAPRARAELLARTESYQALDERTVEWRGIPGLRDPDYRANFFSPLPRHAWGEKSAQDLLADETARRAPLGWGPYMVESWTPGSQISLQRNPSYFRSREGLPYFDGLVFKFVQSADQALASLQAGECDLLDPAYDLNGGAAEHQELAASGAIALQEQSGAAWEHLTFGIVPYNPDPSRPPFFQLQGARQALAQCIDRQRIAAELGAPGGVVMDSYALPGQPLANPNVRRYGFDPAAANALLESLGWLDEDGDSATPRQAFGVAGVPDGTPFAFPLYISNDPAKTGLAQIVAESLAQCGVQVEINPAPPELLFAPGPAGVVFGRNFDLAQFAWELGREPTCSLYLTGEIPGPYPQYPKGWGGANPSGFSDPLFDQACQQALNSLPDDSLHAAAHQQAQALFAEQLPALPLASPSVWIVTRPDFCGLAQEAVALNIFQNLEVFNYGTGCGN
jgi:peptide/nickel transport system substrate-binding protein